MDAKEALKTLAVRSRVNRKVSNHDYIYWDSSDDEALAVLRKVVEEQERHDDAGAGTLIKSPERVDEPDTADGALRRGNPLPGDAKNPAPSPDLSPEDERALSILAGFITHIEVFHSHPNFDPETRKALSHLRRRLSERKRVTREWVRQLVLSYANSVRNGDMNGPESMLRSIGVEVSE